MRRIALACLVLLAAACAAEEGPERFLAVDVLVEGGARPLAAWQLEVRDTRGRAQLVGIEGGEHPAFRDPALHDPRALERGRVVLAAYSLATELPTGRTRVATLSFLVRGAEDPAFAVRSTTAVDAEGEPLAVTFTLETRTP